MLLFPFEVRSRCRSVGEAVGTVLTALTKHRVVYPGTENIVNLCGSHMHALPLKSCLLCKGHLQSQCLDPLVPGSWVTLYCNSEQG